jgi:hypothetical protein
MTEKEPREHGILFGRGDKFGDDVEEPPMGPAPVLPWYGSPVPFGVPPEEDVELTDEVPWELREEPPSSPAIH